MWGGGTGGGRRRAKLWPVLLDTHPRDTVWSLGERVSTRLRWLDNPDLPDDVVLRQIPARAGTLVDSHGRPWAQLIRIGDVLAVREGDHRAGEVTLGGCLGVDAYLGLVGDVPVTVGVVRRVQVVHDLHDLGAGGWVRRPGAVRLTEVPDAGPERLRDEPSLVEAVSPDRIPEAGTMRIVSPKQYVRMFRDQLPAEQWQARGFLVDLEVAGAA